MKKNVNFLNLMLKINLKDSEVKQEKHWNVPKKNNGSLGHFSEEAATQKC